MLKLLRKYKKRPKGYVGPMYVALAAGLLLFVFQAVADDTPANAPKSRAEILSSLPMCHTANPPPMCSGIPVEKILDQWTKQTLLRALTFATYDEFLATKDLYSPAGWKKQLEAMTKQGYIDAPNRSVLEKLGIQSGDFVKTEILSGRETPQGRQWIIGAVFTRYSNGPLHGKSVLLSLSSPNHEQENTAGMKIEQMVIADCGSKYLTRCFAGMTN